MIAPPSRFRWALEWEHDAGRSCGGAKTSNTVPPSWRLCETALAISNKEPRTSRSHDREVVVDGEVECLIRDFDRLLMVVAVVFYLQQQVSRLAEAKWTVNLLVMLFD